MKNMINATTIWLVFLVMLPSAMVVNNNSGEPDGITTVSGTFDDDYLYLGNELHFSGNAEDLIFLGKRMTFDGVARLGLISLCKDMVFTGKAGNGIIGIGMNMHVEGKVKGNSYFLCKSLHVSEKSVVDGNLFAGCAKLFVNGIVNGDLYAGAGEVVINNQINGNVKIYAGRIVMGEKGKINGNLTYAAKEKLKPEDLQKITGTVEVDEKHKFETCEMTRKNWIAFKTFFGIAMFICFVIIGSLLLFIPVFTKLDANLHSERSFWYTGLRGLIPVLMYPAVVVINFILIFTIPFAFILILAAIPVFFFTQIIGLTLLGKYLVYKFKWHIRKRHLQFLIGALAGTILSVIPVVNFLTILFISGLGWGIFINFLFNRKHIEPLFETAIEEKTGNSTNP
ncbi:MAG TPA: polymer-forming cytoskeletal protein [Chitinispirillaceae bacterium]|nr:polymer-forming cytoskeletal protein [Chitinispirillaceae bacterium]